MYQVLTCEPRLDHLSRKVTDISHTVYTAVSSGSYTGDSKYVCHLCTMGETHVTLIMCISALKCTLSEVLYINTFESADRG